MSIGKFGASGDNPSKHGIIFINLGSLLAQIVQIAGYPTLLALTLAHASYPSWIIGIILSFQWIVVLVLAPFVPAIMNSHGIRATAQSGAVVSAIALGLLLVSQSISAIAASAILMGAGLTVRWVACDTWIVEAVPENVRGRVVGIHETLMGLGIAVGPLLTMLARGDETTAIAGYIALMLAASFCFAFGSHVETTTDRQGKYGRMLVVFRILLLALLAAFASGYIETAMVALLPLYLMAFQYPEAQALVCLSVLGLGGTLLQAPLGWIADRFGFQSGQILCISIIIAGAVLLMTAITSPLAVVTVLFVWGGCVGGLNTLAVIEAGSTLRSGLSGTGMALIASSYTLGGTIGPVVSGATLTSAQGHGAILMIIALMVAYAATLTLAGRRTAS